MWNNAHKYQNYKVSFLSIWLPSKKLGIFRKRIWIGTKHLGLRHQSEQPGGSSVIKSHKWTTGNLATPWVAPGPFTYRKQEALRKNKPCPRQQLSVWDNCLGICFPSVRNVPIDSHDLLPNFPHTAAPGLLHTHTDFITIEKLYKVK